MAFRKYGGIQYSSNNNYIRSVLNNPSYLNITQGSGQQQTTEIFYSDLSLVGNLLVEENVICNSGITLPTSATFVTPITGQLGHTYSNSVTQITANTATTYNLGYLTLDVGVYQLNGLFTITTQGTGTTNATLSNYIAMFTTTNASVTAPLGTGVVQGSNMSIAFVSGTTYKYSLSSIYTNTTPSTPIYLTGKITYTIVTGTVNLRLVGSITATRIA